MKIGTIKKNVPEILNKNVYVYITADYQYDICKYFVKILYIERQHSHEDWHNKKKCTWNHE